MNDPRQTGLRSAANDAARISFRVNGREREVVAHPATRLSEVLREQLGLTGTKVGCDAGDCGACTVLLEGRQVCSCLTALAQVSGREVVTVEGLATHDELSVLQRSFLAHGAAQCGACTPGMLIAAAELLRTNAAPSEEEVLDALGGVLCRCTGYRKIVEAVLAVARHEIESPHPPAGAAVGSRIAKLDGTQKVTGREIYGADDYPRDSLWLRVVRS